MKVMMKKMVLTAGMACSRADTTTRILGERRIMMSIVYGA
jgi:hypothetical protein